MKPTNWISPPTPNASTAAGASNSLVKGRVIPAQFASRSAQISVDLEAGLAGATFRLDARGQVAASFAPTLAIPDGAWRFDLRRVDEARILALAVRMDRTATLRLFATRCIPTQGILSPRTHSSSC